MSIFLDLNVRDPFVTTSTDLMIEDTKVIVQSVLRLLTTQEGEIPNYRSYGLDVKQFSQYPLTEKTANYIAKYVEGKINTYEKRVNIVESIMDADYDNNAITMTLILRIKSTGEIVKFPALSISVAA